MIPWFHSEGETEVAESRAIARAGWTRLLLIAPDLLGLEVANVLVAKRRQPADRVRAVMRRLAVLAPQRRLDPDGLEDAIALADEHSLSVYDACYWALARAENAVLVTRDADLLAAGAGTTPAALCERLGLAG